MLARAARRRNALRYIQQSSEQLSLPWLCPALLRAPSAARPSYARATTRTSATSVPRHPMRRKSFDARRHLATATATQEYAPYDNYVPFDKPHASNASRSRSDLADFDPSSPIIINEQMTSRPLLHHRVVRGNGGTLNEMLATLDACLRAGKVDRAQAIVHRLAGSLYAYGSPELLGLHNNLIRGIVSDVIRTRSEKTYGMLQRWFEVDMKSHQIVPDETSYALLLKAALNVPYGSKRDRTIRRYWDMVKKEGMENEVLNLPVLSDLELGKLSEVCPNDLEAPIDVDMPPPIELQERLQYDARDHGFLPDIKPVEQKGLGLSSLKQSLSLFGESHLPYPDNLEGTPEEKDLIYQKMRQVRLEEDAVTAALDRWRKESQDLQKMGIDPGLQRKSVNALMWEWHQTLKEEIGKELALVEESEEAFSKSHEDNDRCTYGPFMKAMEIDKLSVTTITQAVAYLAKQGVDFGTRIVGLANSIGQALEDEELADQVKNRKQPGKMDLSYRARRISSMMKNRSQPVKRTAPPNHTSSTNLPEISEWSTSIRIRLGAVMTSLLTRAAKIGLEQTDPETGKVTRISEPAFSHEYVYNSGKRYGVIKMHASMIEKLKKEPAGGFLTKHLPMVAPPEARTSYANGGFFRYPVEALRSKNSDKIQKTYAEAATERGDLDQLYAGMDVLSKTPWKVNRDVLKVMIDVWNTGEALGKIAPADPKIRFPDPPEDIKTNTASRLKYQSAVRKAEETRSGFHSNRCFQNFQLEIAKAYSEETFYFPHNLDFRGRAYPVSPYFNHMGADHCRGLLLFGEGKELGSSGLRWLKIHVSNLKGFDKASFQDREDFVTNHIEDVRDSALNPLKGKRWWVKAEDPWQCLAACKELTKALDMDDPTKFVSRLPVHQDGSCNGLQHYAALGGDEMGAQQVNLQPGDKPSDVYTGVSELVKKEISEEAAQGSELAKALDGKIVRKIVKQTVMTNVYGVTFVGAVRQVRKQLVDIIPLFPDTTQINYQTAAAYIAKKIFRALATMFTGAHDIQYWLGECASRISTSLQSEQMTSLERSFRQGNFPFKKRRNDDITQELDPTVFKTPVMWTTPMKLPVIQPYRKEAKKRLRTNLQAISIVEPVHKSLDTNKRKQLQAFPPNFIHSLDATHMMLSALKCDEIGLTFAAVHDSFWTHAGDVDTMNLVLRDAFIRMHSEDIIGRLQAEFQARFKGAFYLAQVKSQSRIGKKIREARKKAKAHPEAFSGLGEEISKGTNRFAELIRERKRYEMLHSEDPEVRERAKSIVTPASVFEDLANDPEAFAAELSEAGAKDADMPSLFKADESVDHLTAEEQHEGDEVDANIEALDPLIHNAPKETAAVVEDSPYGEENSDALAVKEGDNKEKPKRQRHPPKAWVWLPITFPPVPKRVCSFHFLALRLSRYTNSHHRVHSTSPSSRTANTSSTKNFLLFSSGLKTPTLLFIFFACSY